MKGLLKVFGTIALIAVIGFSMAACGGNDRGGGGGTGGGGGGITIGNWTYSVQDDTIEGGTSSITMTRGTGADSNKLTFSGKKTNGIDGVWGWVHIGVDPNETELARLRTASSISFKVKGDGTQFSFILLQSDITDWSNYRALVSPTSSETTVTINIDDLIPASWGLTSQGKIPFDQSKVYAILFERDWGEEKTFNITISDLKLNND